jgi:hypothetical protein
LPFQYYEGATRVACEGGIILYPSGKQDLDYEWSLDTTRNNYAEAYVLLREILSINVASMKTLIIIGDSSIIINLMNNK